MLQREMSQFLGGPIEKNRKSIFYRSPEVPTRALCSRLLVFLLLLLQAKRGKRLAKSSTLAHSMLQCSMESEDSEQPANVRCLDSEIKSFARAWDQIAVGNVQCVQPNREQRVRVQALEMECMLPTTGHAPRDQPILLPGFHLQQKATLTSLNTWFLAPRNLLPQ